MSSFEGDKLPNRIEKHVKLLYNVSIYEVTDLRYQLEFAGHIVTLDVSYYFFCFIA